MRLDDGTEVALPLAEIRKARLVLTDALIEDSARMVQPATDAGVEQDGKKEPPASKVH